MESVRNESVSVTKKVNKVINKPKKVTQFIDKLLTKKIKPSSKSSSLMEEHMNRNEHMELTNEPMHDVTSILMENYKAVKQIYAENDV